MQLLTKRFARKFNFKLKINFKYESMTSHHLLSKTKSNTLSFKKSFQIRTLRHVTYCVCFKLFGSILIFIWCLAADIASAVYFFNIFLSTFFSGFRNEFSTLLLVIMLVVSWWHVYSKKKIWAFFVPTVYQIKNQRVTLPLIRIFILWMAFFLLRDR